MKNLIVYPRRITMPGIATLCRPVRCFGARFMVLESLKTHLTGQHQCDSLFSLFLR
jgi:hypothetical protein